MAGEMLTTSRVAERLSVGRSSVNLCCRQGKFPNAQACKEVIGTVRYVPESDLVNFPSPKMGRPLKAKTEEAQAGTNSSGRKKGGKK